MRANNRVVASSSDRIFASIADTIFTLIPLGLVTLLYSLIQPDLIVIQQPGQRTTSNDYFLAFSLRLLHIIVAILFISFQTIKWGRTVGKDIYGLEVVDSFEVKRSPWWNILLRESVQRLIDTVPFINGIITLLNLYLLLGTKSKRLTHDYIAGTQVVKVRERWSMKKQIIVILPAFAFVILLYIFIYKGYPNSVTTNLSLPVLNSERLLSRTERYTDVEAQWTLMYDSLYFARPSKEGDTTTFIPTSAANTSCFTTLSIQKKDNPQRYSINDYITNNTIPFDTKNETYIAKTTGVILKNPRSLFKGNERVSYETVTTHMVAKGASVYILEYSDAGNVGDTCIENEKRLQKMITSFELL